MSAATAAVPPRARWRLTQRDLRLASGLVMLTYIAAHLLNHALGLVSVPLAERGLAIAVAVWHSAPGSTLLYGALTIHVALAFNAIYQRRTLRMPPLELLRMVVGLGIPLMLIGHVVQTRIGWEQFGAVPTYARVVWGLWLGEGEARQLAMLVPGWLHGCLGVHFAFGRRTLYKRLHLPLFGLALLVPVLGGLGFLAMAKELAADAAQRPHLDALATLAPGAQQALKQLRETVLAGYVGAIGLVFGARELRALVERRRKLLFDIAYPQRSVRVLRGWSVLEASRSHGLPHVSVCGGRARCTTCRVRIIAGAANCPPAEAAEQAALRRIGASADVRLACQLRPTGNIGVLPILSPEGRAPGDAALASATEREVALLAVTWRNQAAFAQRHLPQDLLYAAQSFVDPVCAALRAHGGTVAQVSGDQVLAVFGLKLPLAPACRDALAAARSVEQALAAVAERHAKAFGEAMDCTTAVHAGRATIGPLPGGSLLVTGGALAGLRALQTAAGADVVEAVSASTLAHAGSVTDAAATVSLAGLPAVLRRRGEAPAPPA